MLYIPISAGASHPLGFPGARGTVTLRQRSKKRDSKTERIANVFLDRPLDLLSPKDISKELKLEIQLVTTIVNRLMAEGLVERVGWGKYKLKIEQAFDDEYLTKVASDMREMAEKVLGASKLERAGPGDDLKGAFVDLVDLYSRVRSLGGDSLAANLLRLSAKKNLVGKDVESLLSSVEEVVH